MMRGITTNSTGISIFSELVSHGAGLWMFANSTLPASTEIRSPTGRSRLTINLNVWSSRTNNAAIRHDCVVRKSAQGRPFTATNRQPKRYRTAKGQTKLKTNPWTSPRRCSTSNPENSVHSTTKTSLVRVGTRKCTRPPDQAP